MPQVILNSGLVFHSKVSDTILDAALHANIVLPYSCKSGRCSVCRCKVISGGTSQLIRDAVLSDDERMDGWILACAHSAQTDLFLEVEDMGRFVIPPVKLIPCRISEMKYLATDVVQVLLRLPPSTDFCYLPGQYVDITGPNGIRRSYSLANASFADKLLELHIRAVEGGVMSDYWFNHAKPNDLLRLNGPLGTFFLRDATSLDLVFLATGTGIAPVKALLESMPNIPAAQVPNSVTVLWGGRKPQDLYFDVSHVKVPHVYIPVLSRPSDGWTGMKGYVQDALLDLNPDLSNAAVYACGSEVMIQSARSRLVRAGLPANHFYSDAFVSSGGK
jgi:CDP-4-dehydro-6-deoxyglucose reductase